MRAKVLTISEVYASTYPTVYTCYGLGSCIGLFITDRERKISGGAHIPLSAAVSGGGEFRDAVSLIDDLIKWFCSLGSDLNNLQAKITGGSRLFKSENTIGEENAKVVLHELIERKIFIAAKDLGGQISRTARFNSLTRELQISTSEQKVYSI